MTPRSFPMPRVCEGCGKGKGTTPIALHGYWHPACWRRTSEEQRAAVKLLIEATNERRGKGCGPVGSIEETSQGTSAHRARVSLDPDDDPERDLHRIEEADAIDRRYGRNEP